MSDRKLRPGKFVWFELISSDARKAQTFYADVLGWKIRAFPMGNASYDMIFTGEALDTMIGGFGAPPRAGERSRWVSYVSVEDVDATARAATANGGKLLDAPADLPAVGRSARIADAQGAELCLFKRANGDPPDVDATQGKFFWNELHTRDPQGALTFCKNVLGYTHETMGGPDEPYHVLSRDGVGRAGVTGHLPTGEPPHWLPYVMVDDPDATIARARTLGATVPIGPADIPGIGRFGVLIDPTGATLAVMKPLPRQKP
jgi:predicted enzyme related to lactoylglutathione lyase